jgi:uncharacterized protein YeeX (DUF496 family)
MTGMWYLNEDVKREVKEQNLSIDNATLVLDLMDLLGKVKSLTGNIEMTDIPTFIRNRYDDEINEFILALCRAHLIKLKKAKETTIL